MRALERLLDSPEIVRSPQLGRFLDYIVRRAMNGEEQAIKAYSIAVDVFGRPPDFNPQVDPIVRVQARRLRSLLDDYYQGPGRCDLIQIRLPVGRYIPEFVAIADAGEAVAIPDASNGELFAEPLIGKGFVRAWLVLAGVALTVAVLAYSVSNWTPTPPISGAVGTMERPSISVVEFQNLAGAATPAPQAAGLAIELVTDLQLFGDVDARFGSSGESKVTGISGSDYVLTGIVRPDNGLVQYSAILTDTATGTVVWDHTLAVDPLEANEPDVLNRVSRSISLVLGSPRGPLHSVARRLMLSRDPQPGEATLYLCRVLFNLYHETGTTVDAERAARCFAELGQPERDSATALAATAILKTEPQRRGSVVDSQEADRFLAGVEALERAVQLEPTASFVWEQQGRLHEHQGALLLARADFSSAVQLNPANTDALAAFARLLAFSGNLGAAEDMAVDAAFASPEPPDWYFGVPALLALRDEDYARALEAAERYTLADSEIGPILAIMAGQGAGDGPIVNRYLPQVLEQDTFQARGVLRRLGERISDRHLVGQMREALSAAGVPVEALNGSF